MKPQPICFTGVLFGCIAAIEDVDVGLLIVGGFTVLLLIIELRIWIKDRFPHNPDL